MTTDDHERERASLALFERALEASETARESVLREAPPEVRARAEALLTRLESEEATESAEGPEPRSEGDLLGRYRLLRKLGAGSSGEVWEAEEAGLERPVAVKILDRDWLGADAARAFRRGEFPSEARIQARLNHPGIAAVHAVGMDGGRVFVVMELVQGEPFGASVADESRGRTRTVGRLRRFLSLCDAVAHAGQQRVVHGDLKPANVLVTPQGDVKVLDFGVALLMGAAGEDRLIGGTPPYMAPEQRAGEHGVDVRVDVHALGVMLRELLGAAGGDRAPVDLLAVVERATAHDRDERYASASEMGADVRRFLDGRPVEAYGGGLGYVTSRLFVRYRVRASLALLIVAVLAGATVVSTVQRSRAQREADKAWRVTTWMQDLLRAASPFERGRDVLAAELMDDAARRLRDERGLDEETRALLNAALGAGRWGLGELEPAERLLRSALEELERGRGPEDEQVVTVAEDLAVVLRDRGDFAEARELLERCLRVNVDRYGEEHRRALRTRGSLAQLALDEGRFEEAREGARATLEGQRRLLGADDVDVLVTLDTLAQAQLRLGDDVGAGELLEELADRCSERYGPEHVITVMARVNLLAVLVPSEDAMRSVEYGRETVALAERVLGLEHGATHHARSNLAIAQYSRGRFEEAIVLQEAALQGFEEELGPDHPETAYALQALGMMLRASGRSDEARFALEAAAERLEEALGSDHPDVLYTRTHL